jgi:hypothetical protein
VHQELGLWGVQITKLQQANQAHRYSRQIRHTGYSRQSGTPVQQANQAHRVQQAKQTHQAGSKRAKMGQEAREERVQREREVDGEERIGGRIPEETQPQAASPTNEWKWHSRSVQLRDPKRMGRKRAPFMVRSKVHTPSERRRARAILEASEWSGCIRIQPMPVPAQSVFRKQGREES